MKWKIANRRLCLNLIGALVMLIGLGSSIFIYSTAGKDSNNILGYEANGGVVYPVLPEDSKKYLRDLELYGGKTAVLAEEFKHWFAGLWHGKSLAWVVAGTTIFISFCCFYAANTGFPHIPSDVRNENH